RPRLRRNRIRRLFALPRAGESPSAAHRAFSGPQPAPIADDFGLYQPARPDDQFDRGQRSRLAQWALAGVLRVQRSGLRVAGGHALSVEPDFGRAFANDPLCRALRVFVRRIQLLLSAIHSPRTLSFSRPTGAAGEAPILRRRGPGNRGAAVGERPLSNHDRIAADEPGVRARDAPDPPASVRTTPPPSPPPPPPPPPPTHP